MFMIVLFIDAQFIVGAAGRQGSVLYFDWSICATTKFDQTIFLLKTI